MKKYNFLLAAISAVLLAGCNPKYYSPNTQNVPLLEKKGETNLTLSGNGNQVEFQGAYAISENMGLMANGGLFIPSDLDNGNGGSGSFGEVGLGFYAPLENNMVFETYGLIGVGSVENHFPGNVAENSPLKGEVKASVFRVGIQPNLGYKSGNFSAAVSSRFSVLSYSGAEGDLVFDGENQVDYLNANKSNFLIEPALTLRGGLDKVKLQVQVGYSLNASNSDFKQDNGFVTVGLNFNFN
jgi:hypothetical protein